MPKNIPVYQKIYRYTKKYTGIYPYAKKYTRVYSSTKKYTGIYPYAKKYTRVYPYIKKYTGIYPYTKKYTRVYPYTKNIPVYIEDGFQIYVHFAPHWLINYQPNNKPRPFMFIDLMSKIHLNGT